MCGTQSETNTKLADTYMKTMTLFCMTDSFRRTVCQSTYVCVSLLYALNCFYDFNVIISFSQLFVHMIGACLYASLFIEQLRLLLWILLIVNVIVIERPIQTSRHSECWQRLHSLHLPSSPSRSPNSPVASLHLGRYLANAKASGIVVSAFGCFGRICLLAECWVLSVGHWPLSFGPLPTQ